MTNNMISKEAVGKYKRLYKEKFGKDLSDQEALEQATKLINLFRVIYRPIPKSGRNNE